MPPCKETSAKLLVVEGKNDCNGIYQIAARHELQGTFGIWEAGSDRLALSKFGGMLAASENKVEVIGIVLDCDVDDEGNVCGPQRRWAQVAAKLVGYGYIVPSKPEYGGTVLAAPDGLPKVGIWLMPDNFSEGMFEDFLLPLMPESALIVARDAVVQARESGVTSFKVLHESKAIAHTYLAWQDEPGFPLGIAIKAKLFNTSHATATPFVEWLRAMFSSVSAIN